ncbi:ABC transporter ATP-binding protein [Facklamia sp. DSM 111018]|uniref:ABC transporter ATP-binding protein n=1 Tax=Facklamia lactis TaxID=2749967 RepID=A0ABS0LQP5_9LACT|nr:ABC transporter ATP-binding protein [Facklamia lactis]MBG9979531.1 ABC transporter ATP-binding protein [Facklamia lactis]MBG9985800.1 ABC transporter ATP-binding protein [Facklamia lactis]
MTILKLENLSKSFSNHQIIDGVNLEIDAHKIYGFIGPNGSGKTTTIKMILGLLKADRGSISLMGQKVKYGDMVTNQEVGYLPDVPEYYAYMNAREYLELCAGLIVQGKQTASIDDLLNKVGITDDKLLISKYSRGMKQRLGIAQALINQPKLLICDEPTSALDPKGRQDILQILQEVKKETTVIFSTHILSDVERICDEVLVLTHQNIRNLKDIEQDLADRKNRIMISLMVEPVDEERLAKKYKLRKANQLVTIEIPIQKFEKTEIAVKACLNDLIEMEIYPSYFEVVDRSLEDLYIEVVS